MKKLLGKVITGIVITPIVVIMLLILAEVIIIKANDHAAAFTEDLLLETPLPENTEMLDIFHCACGYSYINMDILGYYGGMLVKSDMSLEEIDAYYRRNGQSKGEGYFIVKQQTDPYFKLDTFRRRFNYDFTDGNYYIISIEESHGAPYQVPYDIRGIK